jgi:hypothetical protein
MTMTATESLLLVLDNDRPLYERCMSRAIKASTTRHDEEDRGTWTHEQAEIFHTADDIKELVENLMDDISLKPCAMIQPSLRESADLIARQLISDALQEIQWNEVAEHYLDKVREQAAS